nr:PEPxxWA-CTERM sorting domain-containing protein [Altericroceibacterium xinjiangense]
MLKHLGLVAKLAAFGGAGFLSFSSASAATIISSCSVTDVSSAAVSCAGWYEGNLLNANHVQDQTDALATLGLTWNGNWNSVDLTKVNASGSVFDFSDVLNGNTWIGIHKGRGGRGGFEGTGFFLLNASNLDTVSLNLGGASSAVVYSSVGVVPEPATWAMMLLGFGAIGFAMRKAKRKPNVSVSYA